ncbi:histidine phosphatase family protein [Varunaivibrio sulfuroxidans]|uniref:Alpha-ribazole phosphatase n=1 Tax=Varunaivibrio sulfuroxidans TaxID=1773489 RepID=A0A4V2UP99_9PROT|nr:histidine phosphatase family protein [Varunaivibrio sulfuroxidans]TCS65141.1 alpha-ribazole phosphatase [Varunaivibrio sulfuroxidans]WES29574.1 histidine phosphatase family protein [Varunaivibrio sulfuroxidans]
MNETRWWWVRHAPVAAPYAGLVYGARDVPCDLSETCAVAAVAERLPMDAVWVTSALSRTVATAAALRRAPEGARPFALAALNEQSFGDWQGRAWRRIETEDKTRYDAFWADPGRAAPPGGESFAALAARAGEAIAALNVAHGGRDIIAVAHAGVIRAALALALDIPAHKALPIAVDTLSISRIDCFRDEGRPASWRINAVNARAASKG